MEIESDEEDELNNGVSYINITGLQLDIVQPIYKKLSESLNRNLTQIGTYLSALKHKPHVKVCSASWRVHEEFSHDLENYEAVYNKRNINNADGVMIYVIY